MTFRKKLAWAWLAIWYGSALLFSGSNLSHHLEHALEHPSLTHPLGFDAFGRDLGIVVLQASATSSLFALGAVTLSTFCALVFGSLSSFAPGPIRFAFLRTLESLLAFPSLFFALAYAAVRGPGWDTLIVALLVGTLPSFTRLIYVRTRELLVEDYVTAARSLGASSWQLFKNHLSPFLISLCGVKFPNLFAHALLAEATLSFLGVGAPIGRDTWGSILFQGKDYLLEDPHIAFGAGIPLVLTVLFLQVLTEADSGNHSVAPVKLKKNSLY